MSDCCPLYKDACEAKPWTKRDGAHAGLLFDKFAHAWTTGDKGYEFKKEGPDSWLHRFAKHPPGSKVALKEACDRQRRLVSSMGGRVLCFKNTARFVTGLGREHPIENGFVWHHTLGAPYLPGSGLKGVLRAWMREEGEDDSRIKNWFGTPDAAGRFTLLDLLPAMSPTLAVDVMTPHYGPYYQDTKGCVAPGDWHSPVPISFLVVEQGAGWQAGLLPAPGQRALAEGEVDTLIDWLVKALDWLGAGAKTAVGYGRFKRDEETECELRRELEARRRQEAEARRQEERLRQLPPDLAQLQRQATENGWFDTTDKNTFLGGAEAYLKEIPEPSDECIDWLGKQLVRLWPAMGAHPDIWTKPDAMRGRRNNKYVHPPRARELVERLKAILKNRNQT